MLVEAFRRFHDTWLVPSDWREDSWQMCLHYTQLDIIPHAGQTSRYAVLDIDIDIDIDMRQPASAPPLGWQLVPLPEASTSRHNRDC